MRLSWRHISKIWIYGHLRYLFHTSNGLAWRSESTRTRPWYSNCCHTFTSSRLISTDHLKIKTLTSSSVEATSSFNQEHCMRCLSAASTAPKVGITTILKQQSQLSWEKALNEASYSSPLWGARSSERWKTSFSSEAFLLERSSILYNL